MSKCVFYNMLQALSLVLLLVPSVYAKYPIQNFSPFDYRAGNQNIAFAQNRDMSLFVANNLGLLSYNGVAWEGRALQTGKKQRSVAFQEQSNRLYVGSQGDFGYFEADWSYTSLLEKVPEGKRNFDDVWEVFIHETAVYFCTFNGIYIYEGDTLRVVEYAGGLERSFFVDGRLYSQSRTGRLLILESGNFVAAFPQNNTNDIIAGIVPHNQGMIIFYNSGVIEFTNTFGVQAIYPNLSQALRGKYVNHILHLSDNRLAISTQTAGLFLFHLKENSIEQITTEEGLETNACLRAFEDFSGNLWVGMQNGIAVVYINSPMRFLSQEIGLEGSGYDALEMEEGTYYTTSNGIYFLLNGQTKAQFLSGTEGPAYGLQTIGGRIYAGHHTGLFLLNGSIAQRVASTDGLWQIKPLRSNPRYAIAGSYSGLYLFEIKGNQLEFVQKISGFEETSRFFEEDSHGDIWVGQYYKGLFKLRLDSALTQVEVLQFQGQGTISTDNQIVLSTINNELSLATNAGVYQLNLVDNVLEKADLFYDEIGEQPVYLFEQDNQRNVHVLADDRVGFFKQISPKNYAFVPSSLFQLRYFLNNDLLSMSTDTSDGVLFSANNGFIHYNPDLETRAKNATPLLVQSIVSVNQDSVVYRRSPFKEETSEITKLSLSKHAKVVQFNMEAFQYNNLNDLQFRYYLKGLDEDFGDWTTSSMKEYTNLKDGNYEFIAQTRDFLGEITTSQPVSFTLNPPFYKSLFAKIIYVLVGLVLLYLLSRVQKKKYKKKAADLEAENEKAIALREENFSKMEMVWEAERKAEQERLQAIEREKEQELTILKAEKMESELRHLNNLLAASTMNLVVKNEFIENIKGGLQDVQRKGQNKETKQAIEQIVQEIDTTLRLQEDWEQFEHHFDQVHGDFLSRLRRDFPKLSPNDQKLCAFLRLNLNTKEIANIMNVSSRGVEIARYRLRKKLGLEKGANLAKTILEY
ncbi:MAG: hypothetical protein KTR13_06775 [Saprospiraceae bacterium]|nr:hypothetical protein [Saprospiraceae bacterium]